MQYVVVGAGPAGVTAADTLRALDPAGRVVLISDEPEPPYARMALPYLLGRDLTERGLRLRRRADHFRLEGIELRHSKVAGIAPADRRITLADGSSLPYDRLLLATGSRPWTPLGASAEVPAEVGHCWTLADARAIAEKARDGAHVALLGAGFVACVILKALVARGCRVTVVTGPTGRLVRTTLCPAGSALLQAWCEARGVTFVKGERLAAIEPGPVLAMQSGRRIAADLAIVATGVEANAGAAVACGLEVDRGIVVDERMQTSAPGIYAAGDVAQCKRFGSGELQVHPIHPAAVEHGRYAAYSMTGRSAPHRGSLPMNFFDALGLPCASFGAWQEAPERQLSEWSDPGRHRLLRLALQDDRLVGATVVGLKRHLGALRGLIQQQRPLGRWSARLARDPHRYAEAFVACGS